ncbi:DUF120 domain-containing protein [Halobellus sp. GM3]|uniref:DUF120 domain-containing protein n=1 Tax=Halobellus sp. GM3 TaxID=3458410 RepID=UPI00403E30DE
MTFTTRGEVTSGLGKGQEFVTLDGYVDQFQTQLGYKPFPGTLNVEVAENLDREFDKLDPIRIDGWCDGDRSFGAVNCYPATVDPNDGDQEFPLHVLVPKRTEHDPSTLEIIAPVKLREALDLSDGSTVSVRVESR